MVLWTMGSWNLGESTVGTPAADDLWAKVAAAVRAQLSEATWNTWFQGVHAEDATDDTLILAVPSSVAVERIRTSYLGLLTDAVQALTGVPHAIELVVSTTARADEPEADPAAAVAPPPVVVADDRSPRSTDGDGSPWPTTQLNPRYTFDQFVIGASNRFAHAAALSVAESPARSYNPLFIYGTRSVITCARCSRANAFVTCRPKQ
jgi:chromosomal replication initiator protein